MQQFFHIKYFFKKDISKITCLLQSLRISSERKKQHVHVVERIDLHVSSILPIKEVSKKNEIPELIN